MTLVNAQEILSLVWSEQSRPSLRWLRTATKNRAVPCVRVGRLVFYDPEAVTKALTDSRTVRAKK